MQNWFISSLPSSWKCGLFLGGACSREWHPVQMGCSKQVSLVGHFSPTWLRQAFHSAGTLLLTNESNPSHCWAERKLPWLSLMLLWWRCRSCHGKLHRAQVLESENPRFGCGVSLMLLWSLSKSICMSQTLITLIWSADDTTYALWS